MSGKNIECTTSALKKNKWMIGKLLDCRLIIITTGQYTRD
jgi:hypothetical protein